MMKMRVYPLVLLMVFVLSGCTLVTDNDGGQLEGMWHLTRIEPVSAASNSAVEDLSEQHIFWSFQARLLELDDKTGTHSSYLYRFAVDNGELRLTSPYLFDRENGDKPMEAYDSVLSVYGVKSLTPVYKIESIGGRRMILNDGTVRLCFQKF